MKKIVALTLSPLFLFANPSEILKEEKAEEKAIQQQNLDYLFDSKFLLDDYTYKRKPNPCKSFFMLNYELLYFVSNDGVVSVLGVGGLRG